MSFENQRKPVYVIAEAGVNHNGSIELAKQLVTVAANAGADAVKFQTFKADQIVTQEARKAVYQRVATGDSSQYEMLKKLELQHEAHYELFEFSKALNIQFLSTGFDLDSLKFLNDMGLPLFKIPSGEITNYPLLKTASELGKPLVVSTGMATLDEIGQCLDVLRAGGLSPNQITVLHCNTQYPTPLEDVNLRAMQTIQAAFPDVAIGYSDHTLGIEIPIAAVALGATLIEKHFTLDNQMEGPDHAASLEPCELQAMVTAIRHIEKALGDGEKKPSPSETPNKIVARKSIVAACSIKKGELFSADNLTTKRPGTGRSPMHWPDVIGQPALRDYEVDDFID